MKIGFIGLGAMGFPMSGNLIKKGFQVVCHDINQERVSQLVAKGAINGNSVTETAVQTDILITMLPTSKEVDQVVLAAGQALDHLKPGGLLMDMSTIDPSTTDKLAKACQAKGVQFVDAPVGRLASHAERGESLFMVGGSAENLERVGPLLNAMGTTIHHCGDAGTGIRMKIVNNYMLLVTSLISSEAILLGRKFGLSVKTMKEVTAGTTATNGQFQIALAGKCLVGDVTPGFTLDLAYKDVNLALDAAKELRLGLPVGGAAREIFGMARAGDYAKKDYSAMLNYICERAGVEMPRLD